MASSDPFVSKLIRWGLPLAIVAVGVAVFAAIGGRQTAPPPPESTEPAPLVETATVEPHRGGLHLEVDGIAVPYREIGLAAEVAGRIAYKAPECRAGRYVARGTLLVEIDPRNYELEVQRLQKEYDQAGGTLEELDVETQSTQTLIDLAQEDWALQNRQLQRAQDIYAKRASTDTALDEAKRAELTSRQSMQTFKNQIQMLRTKHSRLEFARELVAARMEQAKLDLARTKVTAPIDGVIVADPVEQDDYVQIGGQLVLMEDTAAVEVQCSFRMEELDWLWQHASPGDDKSSADQVKRDYELPETPVTVLYRMGEREFAWDGVLTRHDGIGLDEATRTVPCRVLVAEPRGVRVESSPESAGGTGPRALVRGMYVRVRVHARTSRPLLRLPQRSVQPGSFAWRVRKGRLDVIHIDVVSQQGETVLVAADAGKLQAGDRVVVSPLVAVANGMAVREAAPR